MPHCRYDIPELIQRVTCSSPDGYPEVVTHDTSVDVLEQPSRPVQTAGSDDYSDPEAAYDVPKPLRAVQPLFAGKGEDSGDISDSDIYDVPRPQNKNPALLSEYKVTAEEEEQKKLSTMDISGPALQTVTDCTDIQESHAQKNSS
uniref:Uncharacterized protein n=1 Tax=Pyxicephalus adspersus TaxID=30357 RepID=A0AAV3ABY5_PYXAD|nr:TPA: hypothetical protein GDO54_012960 [Pyxicephalus adspersus]